MKFKDQLEEEAKSGASTLIRHTTFRYFLEELGSKSLLVNGSEDTAAADSISPLSLIITKMARTVKEHIPGILILKYFCAFRPIYRLSGGLPPDRLLAKMMASLLGQLLEQIGHHGMPPDLSSLTTDELEKIETLTVRDVTKVFRRLTRQIPRNHIVIRVIDETGEFETAILQEQTTYVTRVLAQVGDLELCIRKGGPTFKLLLTCRDRGLYISPLLLQTLDIEEDIEEDCSADWNISRLGQ